MWRLVAALPECQQLSYELGGFELKSSCLILSHEQSRYQAPRALFFNEEWDWHLNELHLNCHTK